MRQWYLRKAAQCERLSKEVFEPHRRAELEVEAKLWLEIAAQIEKDELLRLGPKPE
jgi:hypothetical protein